MTSYLFIYFKRRSVFLFLGVVLLAVGIFLGQGQELSWAAPEQSPYSQTVPPRPPTPTPISVEPTPDADGNNDSDQDGHDDGFSLPTEPVEQGDDLIDDETKPSVQPPLPDDGAKNDEVSPPIPSGGQDSSEDNAQTSSSIQPTELDDEEEFPVVFQQADLSLSQRADKAVANVGETLTFMIEVSNKGPDNATHVTVSNPLPAGLSLSAVTSSHGNFNRDQGLWTIAGITAGQSVSLSLEVIVIEAGVITNTTEIIAADQFDPDSTPGNGLSHEDDQASVPITVSAKTEQTSPFVNGATALTSTTVSSVGIQPLPGEVSLSFWFFGLMGGLVLVLIGLFLVRRS